MTFRRRLLAPALALLALACGDDGSSPSEAFGGYVAVGGGLTAGFAADGLVYDGQSAAYPAALARAAGVTFEEARVQAPGCVPPLVTPLYLDRTLAGARAFTAPRDTTCAARFADSVFARNLAVPEATAYVALRFTTDSAARAGDARTRRALGRILLEDVSQVDQAALAGPSLASVELAFGEFVRAVRSGRMAAATEATYRGDTAFTYVPLAVWRPAYDSALAALRGVRRGVLLGAPSPLELPALRAGGLLHAARDSLRGFGVLVADDCAGSTNLVNVAKVAAAAASAARAGAGRALSCADVAGAVDSVLTAADVAALVALRDAMNGHVAAAAQQRGWAVVIPAVHAPAGYDARRHLAGARPFGSRVSADGIYPSAEGQRAIAVQVAAALRERYGIAIEVAAPALEGTP